MQVNLVLVQSDGSSKEFQVPRLPARLGRGEECQVRIPLSSVSRTHCELLVKDDELVVRDLGSSNGTFVNGDRVQEREVFPGDLLAIGTVVFVIQIDGHPEEVDPIESYAAGSVSYAPPSRIGSSRGTAADDDDDPLGLESGGTGGPAGGAKPSSGSAGTPRDVLGGLMDDDSDDSDFDFDLDLGDDEDK